MNTQCCTQNCSQGRRCPLSKAAVINRCIGYGICSIAACLLAVIIGASQALENYDEQKAQAQVMACSEHKEACRVFFEQHATAPANPRK